MVDEGAGGDIGILGGVTGSVANVLWNKIVGRVQKQKCLKNYSTHLNIKLCRRHKYTDLFVSLGVNKFKIINYQFHKGVYKLKLGQQLHL